MKGGGVFYQTPPLYFIPPRFAKEFDFLTCAGRAFLTFKKSPFEKYPCYKLLLEHTSFITRYSPSTEHQPHKKAQVTH
jgi:hypothetical protein